KEQTLHAILAVLLALAEQQPVLFIVEDLHWIDPSTLELLGLLIDQVPSARLFTLLTCRPEFRPPWTLRAHLTQLTLSRLPRGHPGPGVSLRATAGRVAAGRGNIAAGPGAAGRGGVALPARGAAAGHVSVQACPDPGGGLSVVTQEHPTAISSAHRTGVGGTL